MTRDIVIIGAGGLGRSIGTLIDAINRANSGPPAWNIIRFVDDNPSPADVEKVARRGSIVSIGVAEGCAMSAGQAYVIGIGSGAIRENLAAIAEVNSMEPATLIHPTAQIGAQSTIEPGSMVCAGACVDPDVTVGRHVLLNKNSITGHDSVLADYVSVGPVAVLGGASIVGARTTFGMHAMTIPGVHLSHDVTVGAGACVTRSIPDERTVKGVPAR